MPATDADVLELAKWLYQQHVAHWGADFRVPLWDDAHYHQRTERLAVARALLEQPPDVVRRAVRRLETED